MGPDCSTRRTLWKLLLLAVILQTFKRTHKYPIRRLSTGCCRHGMMRTVPRRHHIPTGRVRVWIWNAGVAKSHLFTPSQSGIKSGWRRSWRTARVSGMRCMRRHHLRRRVTEIRRPDDELPGDCDPMRRARSTHNASAFPAMMLAIKEAERCPADRTVGYLRVRLPPGLETLHIVPSVSLRWLSVAARSTGRAWRRGQVNRGIVR